MRRKNILVRVTTAVIALFVGVILPSSVLAATLSLSPSAGTINKGCDVTIAINLDTQGVQTDGTDAILLFQPSQFQAKTITNGTIYGDYPGNSQDNAAGKVTVSGLASVAQAFSGQGTLATVTFTVSQTAPSGPATINFDFDSNNKAKTTDSNVVERQTILDKLDAVTNGNFTIGTGSCSGSTSTVTTTTVGIKTPVQGGSDTTGTSPIQQIPVKTLPQSGIEGPTLVLSIVGGFLVVAGIAGLLIL